eukprot:scaffold305_cov247-Pinguiococcus_pyrenoidosus.AAC.27
MGRDVARNALCEVMHHRKLQNAVAIVLIWCEAPKKVRRPGEPNDPSTSSQSENKQEKPRGKTSEQALGAYTPASHKNEHMAMRYM